jgi:hypothetical protein
MIQGKYMIEILKEKALIFRRNFAQIFGRPNEFKFSAQIYRDLIYWALNKVAHEFAGID